MATGRPPDAICRIVEDRILELETEAGRKPFYNGVLMIVNMLILIDDMAWNLSVYNCHDGKRISSYRLKSRPRDVCLISENEVAVCLYNGKVEVLSLKLIDDVKRVKTLKTEFFVCHSLSKWNSDKLVISGEKDYGMMCWGIVSITNGRLDSTHKICQGTWTNRAHTAITDNTVYISCQTMDSINNGVHAIDLLNPNTKKFLYRHQELKTPGSIMSDRDYLYVCDDGSNRIHQLTDSGQLVTIHTVSSSLDGIFYDDQHGLLYTTCYESNVITVYKMESLHQLHVIWSKENNPEFHNNNDHILRLMEQLNIIAIPRIFSEEGKKTKQNIDSVEETCLSTSNQTMPRECQKPVQEGALPPGKKYHAFFIYASQDIQWVKKTVEKLETDHGFICCEYDRDNTPGTPILEFVDDSIRNAYKTVLVLTREAIQSHYVRHEIQMAIEHGFFEKRKCIVPVLVEDCDIPGYLKVFNYVDARDNIKSSVWWPKLLMELEMKVKDIDGQDKDDANTPITQEHINHTRLCNALISVCSNALREILLTYIPIPYKDIYTAILANNTKLNKLNKYQYQLVFPDPQGLTTGKVEEFDISLLYAIIRNVSSVPAPSNGWGKHPTDNPRDTTLGASVERILICRNHISSHSVDGKISQQEFEDYWVNINEVLREIEIVIGNHGYLENLKKRKNQIITLHEARELQKKFQEYKKQTEAAASDIESTVEILVSKVKKLRGNQKWKK